MEQKLSNSKIISITPYIDNVSEECEVLTNQNKIQILEKTFEIMGKSCRVNACNSTFYKMFFSKEYPNIFHVRLESSTEPDYKDQGCINGMAINFTITDKSIRGNVFIGNINGMSKYCVFGLQKYKETEKRSHYYHMLDGRIISSITFNKKDDFLEEISHLEKIEAFMPKRLKKYKIKKGNVNN